MINAPSDMCLALNRLQMSNSWTIKNVKNKYYQNEFKTQYYKADLGIINAIA